jgi:hypothetical protein
MEAITWFFGLFSLVGGVYTIIRHPRWSHKALGLLPPAIYLLGMAGISWIASPGFVAFSDNVAIDRLVHQLFFSVLPSVGGLAGLFLAVSSERARTRQRVEETLARIRAGQPVHVPRGPFR